VGVRGQDAGGAAGGVGVESDGVGTGTCAEAWTARVGQGGGEGGVSAGIGCGGEEQRRHRGQVGVVEDPAGCQTALALYVRRVFWSHPLHRLYAVLPGRLPQSRGYEDLLRECGFVNEGTLVGHLMVKRRLLDLDVFGLLRSEFDDWCRQREPHWLR